MNPKEDRLFRASLIALLVLYAVGGNLVQLFGTIGQPRFVDFGLITTTRDAEVSHYELKFTELNNESLPEPLYFADANAWIDKAEQRAAKKLINKIGSAAFLGDSETAEELRAELEQLYFDELVSAEYRVVLRVVDTGGRFPFKSKIVDQTLEKFRFSRALTSNTVLYSQLEQP